MDIVSRPFAGVLAGVRRAFASALTIAAILYPGQAFAAAYLMTWDQFSTLGYNSGNNGDCSPNVCGPVPGALEFSGSARIFVPDDQNPYDWGGELRSPDPFVHFTIKYGDLIATDKNADFLIRYGTSGGRWTFNFQQGNLAASISRDGFDFGTYFFDGSPSYGITGLSEVPESNTWYLLIFGFGCVGMALRLSKVSKAISAYRPAPVLA